VPSFAMNEAMYLDFKKNAFINAIQKNNKKNYIKVKIK
jgi:hypothetical protein